MIKTIYEFEIYSNKGAETVKAETSYKPFWQVEREVEQAYKTKNNIESSVIDCLIDQREV